jgi:DNA-binding CsgD family transcriptional regulator
MARAAGPVKIREGRRKAGALHHVLDRARERPRAASVSDAHLASVYRYALANGGIATEEAVGAELGLDPAEVAAAVEQLFSAQLLREQIGGTGCLVAVDPEIAAALLVTPMEQEIAHRRELIAQVLQRTETLRQDYASSSQQPGAPAAIEHVTGCMEVRGTLKLAGDACRDQVMVLLSGHQEDLQFNDYLRVCAQLLERGITVQIICQHRSRADLVSRMKIKQVIDAGALVRTVSHLPRAAVVFDRSLAVLLGSTDGEATAARVRDDDVVKFLLDMFDHLWDGAMPLDSFESGYAEVAGDLRQTIAGLMAKGYTDEVLARKMGMSVRTCRRHIASLMHDLDAVSRFQAGVQAARRSIVAGS